MDKIFGKSSTIKYIDNKGKLQVIIDKKRKNFDIKLDKELVEKTIQKKLIEKEKIQNQLNKESNKLQNIFIKQLKNNRNNDKNKIVKEIGHLTNQLETIEYTIRYLQDYQQKNKYRIIRTIEF